MRDELIERVPRPGEAHYQYNDMHPGPLGSGTAARSFDGGRYSLRVLAEDETFYRAGARGDPWGQYFAKLPPPGETFVRIDQAVRPTWTTPDGNVAIRGTTDGSEWRSASSPIDTLYECKIPKGTIVYEGPIRGQGGSHIGGTEQTFVAEPWNIRGAKSKRIGTITRRGGTFKARTTP